MMIARYGRSDPKTSPKMSSSCDAEVTYQTTPRLRIFSGLVCGLLFGEALRPYLLVKVMSGQSGSGDTVLKFLIVKYTLLLNWTDLYIIFSRPCLKTALFLYSL
jgi:hypothetical protein